MENDMVAQLAPNPFNPGSQVDPNDFVGRTQEIENFKQKLRQTAGGSLASMAVAGGYGAGKTSFLHKCRRIAEAEGALTIYFSLSELQFLDKQNLANELINRIREKVEEEVILQRLSKSVLTLLSKIRIRHDVGVEVGVNTLENSSYPNLQSALKDAWKAISGSKIAVVFLIDEAGVLEKNKGELMLYLRAVLEQLQSERIPVMFVPAGKLALTGPSGTGFSPLVRTFPPAIMENFTFEESRIFINNKLKQVGVGIKDELAKKVYEVTEGHPFVLTAYMAAAYSKLQPTGRELTASHFNATDVEFVSRVLAPFFSRFYDDAGPGSRQILSKIAESSSGFVTLSGLSEALKKDNNQLSPFLGKLVQDGAVIRVERGKYRLFHHLFADYIKKSKLVS